jgi:hypothetical protein
MRTFKLAYYLQRSTLYNLGIREEKKELNFVYTSLLAFTPLPFKK